MPIIFARVLNSELLTMQRTTLVLGASNKSYRYSYMAANDLQRNGLDVVLVGRRQGEVNGLPILTEWPNEVAIDTITMYLNTRNQLPYYDDILNSGARRIIFNPGAENGELAQLAIEKGMEVENACTLVMLATNQY